MWPTYSTNFLTIFCTCESDHYSLSSDLISLKLFLFVCSLSVEFEGYWNWTSWTTSSMDQVGHTLDFAYIYFQSILWLKPTTKIQFVADYTVSDVILTLQVKTRVSPLEAYMTSKLLRQCNTSTERLREPLLDAVRVLFIFSPLLLNLSIHLTSISVCQICVDWLTQMIN